MAGCFHQLKIDYCVPVDENKLDKSLREIKPLEKIKKAIRNVISVLQRLPLTRALEGFFSLCLNLSFRERRSTVSMVFHAL